MFFPFFSSWHKPIIVSLQKISHKYLNIYNLQLSCCIIFNDKNKKIKERLKVMQKITKEIGLIEIVQQYPQTIEVFQKYGLGCIGCAAARFENLEAGAKVHGIDPDKMVEDLNAVIG